MSLMKELLEGFEDANGHRPLRQIAREIRDDWKNMSVYARPYYEAMADLNKITDSYGADSAYSVVVYFLSNAASWKGETARRVKAELKKMCKDYEKLDRG